MAHKNRRARLTEAEQWGPLPEGLVLAFEEVERLESRPVLNTTHIHFQKRDEPEHSPRRTEAFDRSLA
jgi:hypothetical protein